MRLILTGLAAFGVLWLASQAAGPSGEKSETSASTIETADQYAARIGNLGNSAGGQPDVTVAIAPEPNTLAAPPAPARVRYDGPVSRQTWGRPAEFAPPE